MADWADRLVADGQADAQMVAEAERVVEAAALQPGDTVLDVGAGLGLLTLAAHERIGDGWVIAVDPSVGALEELLRLAHEVRANGIMYLVGDPGVLPLPDASVDAALLQSVLVHVDDVGVVVAELARVLRPGGRLSLSEPSSRDGVGLSGAIESDRLVAQLERVGFTAIERSLEHPDETSAEPRAGSGLEQDSSLRLFVSARRP